MTKYYYVIKALPESSIERIPELLLPPAGDPYSVFKARLMELYDLSDYEKAELLMALPPVEGDVRPSMLLCFYHATCGRRALKCRCPCCWSGPRETPEAGTNEPQFLP